LASVGKASALQIKHALDNGRQYIPISVDRKTLITSITVGPIISHTNQRLCRHGKPDAPCAGNGKLITCHRSHHPGNGRQETGEPRPPGPTATCCNAWPHQHLHVHPDPPDT